MNIGTVNIEGRFVLAPMAAVNCTAFRLLCKENKAGLIYTQMIDTDLLRDRSRSDIKEILNIQDAERPVSVQLIGNDENALTESVKLVEEFADIVDLNVGCSEKEFLEKGYGAYLLSDPTRLERIVRRMVDATEKPVTVKMRIGVENQKIIGVKVAQSLESAGIAALCVHGRTADQKLAGKVNWTSIKQIKEKLAIPVIANGDVKRHADGLSLLEKTGCDLVMVGRGARDRPWIFDPTKATMGNRGIKAQILRFIELYREYERRGSAQEVREHVFWMLKDFKTEQNTRKVQELRSIGAVEDFVRALE
ncbi:MAG: tRNA-dihydrouridine synthase [Candidatus Bathyarchaeota archaeon]|nr:tRNA-dihydrouridine synthase [Candidatus Bathyarchaeota archaeon]